MADDARSTKAAGRAPATTGLVMLASLVVIFAGVKAAENLIVPFLLAVFIAVIVSPVMLSLRRRGVGPAAPLMEWLRRLPPGFLPSGLILLLLPAPTACWVLPGRRNNVSHAPPRPGCITQVSRSL